VERAGFEPACSVLPHPDLQSGAFNHSAISPHGNYFFPHSFGLYPAANGLTTSFSVTTGPFAPHCEHTRRSRSACDSSRRISAMWPHFWHSARSMSFAADSDDDFANKAQHKQGHLRQQ
jgi:hypothetical protein